MILADPLYASGTFWGAVGAIAVLVTGALATLVAFILANPVRRLQCVMSAAPLLKASPQGMSGLQITWNGTELREPNVLDVSITNRGRRDITGDDFDLKQPLEFRVHAEILAILGTSTTSNSTAVSAVAFDDGVLKVGPGLIPRHQTIKFTLLAIGAAPALSSAAAALREVKVDVLTEDETHQGKSARFRAVAGLANLSGITLSNANLASADFDGAVLSGASLRDANLNYAFLGDASLAGADLAGANLAQASLYQTTLCRGAAPTQAQRGYNCSANG